MFDLEEIIKNLRRNNTNNHNYRFHIILNAKLPLNLFALVIIGQR